MPHSKLACPDHKHLITKLQAVENEYLKGGTLCSDSILHLIQQAQRALQLDQAGEALNQSSARYIKVLEDDNERLRNIIDTERYKRIND